MLVLSNFTDVRLSEAEGLLTDVEGLESVVEGLVFVADGLSDFLAVTVPFLTADAFLSRSAEGLEAGPEDGLVTEDPEVEPGAVLLTLVFPDAGLDDDEVRDSPLRVWASASA